MASSFGRSTQLTFNNTLGAMMIGFAVSCLVYGIVLSQISTYFTRYPTDKALYKILVIVIWCLETVDQVFIGHFVYFYTISNFANPLALLTGDVTWSLILQLTFGALVGVIVKVCFVMRVWRFSKHNAPITGILLVTVLGQLCLVIAYTAKAFTLHSIYEVSRLRVLGTISLAIGVATDVLIAASLCFFLRSYRTGHHSADTLVNALSRYAINTGALTSAVSLCTLILYNAMPSNNFIFVAVYFSLSKLYAVSFMATLNTRRIIRGRGTEQSHAQSSLALSRTTVQVVLDSSQNTSSQNAVELDALPKRPGDDLNAPVIHISPNPSTLTLHGQQNQWKTPDNWHM